jgi:hypothetical protein
MPDLLAGTIVNALDTPPTVENVQTGNFSFNLTTFGIDADSGTYVDCGVAFTAPTTGRVVVHMKGTLFNDTAAQNTVLSMVIRAGSTVGAGAVFQAASDDQALVNSGTNPIAIGQSELVTGLTPGDVYNVRLEHRVGANIGTILRRWVAVQAVS